MPLFRILGLLSLAVLLNACKDIDDPTPPTAEIVSITCDTYVCNFVGTGTNGDADGELGFSWDFGDGQVRSGRTVENVYVNAGTYTVRLVAIDRLDQRGSTTQELVINATSEVAIYHRLVRALLSDLIHIADFHRATATQVPALKTAIENQVTATDLPAAINCGIAGAAEVTGWNDSNADNIVDSGETIAVTMDGCQFDAAAVPLHASEAMNFTAIAADGSFKLDAALTEPGIRLDDYAVDYVTGLFTLAPSTSLVDAITLVAPQYIRFLRTSPTVHALLSETRLVEPIITFKDDLSYFDGSGELQGTVTGNWKFQIIQPLVMNDSAGDITVTAGTLLFSVENSTTAITVSVDADPAYLFLSVENDTDADPDREGRLEQRLVVRRASTF